MIDSFKRHGLLKRKIVFEGDHAHSAPSVLLQFDTTLPFTHHGNRKIALNAESA
jgi:hypothetical protein